MATYIADPNDQLALSQRYRDVGGTLVLESATSSGDVPGTTAPTLPAYSRTPVEQARIRGNDLALGAFAANSLSGFTNVASRVDATTDRGGTYRTIYGQTRDSLVAQSTAVARDMSVTGYMGAGALFLRLTPAGRCFYLTHFIYSGEIGIGVSDGIVDGDADLEGKPRGGFAVSAPAGYSATATQGHLFRLSAEGFRLWAEFSTDDGATWTTFFDHLVGWRHMEPGRAAWQARDPGVEAYREIGYTTYADAPLWSDAARVGDGGYANKVYDPVDFGLRDTLAGGAQTTGTIFQGSNELFLAASIGSKVGDGIIVQRTSADTPGPGGYRAATSNPGDRWYDQQSRGFSMRANVLAVSEDGKTLELDQQALAGVSGAKVYYDNEKIPLWQESFGLLQNNPDVTIRFPAGGFHFGAHKIIASGCPDLVVEGAGERHTTVHGVEGLFSTGLEIASGSHRALIQHMGVQNHFTPERYREFEFVSPFTIDRCDDPQIRDVRDVDCSGGIGFRYCNRPQQLRTDTVVPVTLTYVQWHGGGTESDDFYSEDVKVQCERFGTGMEPFRMDRAHILRLSQVNCSASNNSSDNTWYERPHFWFDEDCIDPRYDSPLLSPALNYNLNAGAGSVSGGGRVDRMVIAFGGRTGTQLLDQRNGTGPKIFTGFNASGPWGPILMNGGAYWIKETPASAGIASHATNMEGEGHVLDGVYTNSNNGPGYPGGDLAPRATGTIRNCVANTLPTRTGLLKENNLTVQEWRDTLGPNPALPTAAFRIALGKSPDGSFIKCWTHDEDTGDDLCTSPYGEIVRYEWRQLRGGVVVGTDRGRCAYFLRQIGDTVELAVWDQLYQSTVTTQVVTV